MAAGALVAPAATAVPAPRAGAGSISIRLLDASVTREKDPRARLYVDDHVAQGATIVRHVEVANTTGRALPLSYYAAAATIGNGSFNIGSGHAANELTGWTTVSPRSSTVPSGGRQVLTVTIHVPADAGNGERYAAVLADYEPPASKGTVTEGGRVGIRIYLSVGEGREPKSDFVIDTLTAGRDSSGVPFVTASVHNTGERALDIAGSLRLTDGPGGLSAGPFATQLGSTLAPGQTEPVLVKLSKQLPAGPWHARIDLQSGEIKRAAEGTITFPTANGSKAAPVKAKNIPLTKNRNFLVPLALLLLLGLAIGIFFLLWKRRKRKEDEEEQAPSPTSVRQ